MERCSKSEPTELARQVTSRSDQLSDEGIKKENSSFQQGF